MTVDSQPDCFFIPTVDANMPPLTPDERVLVFGEVISP